MPTQHTQPFGVKLVCQITYENQTHKARTSTNCMKYSTLCLSKTIQFSQKAQDLATTIKYQSQAPSLLLATTTHSLPIILRKW
jgi:hypothetical protein